MVERNRILDSAPQTDDEKFVQNKKEIYIINAYVHLQGKTLLCA